MPQKVTLDTITTAATIGSNMLLRTSYFLITPILAFIASVVGSLNGIRYTEGDGIIANYGDDDVSFYLTGEGYLIATGSDAGKFSVDPDTGQLQYTTE